MQKHVGDSRFSPDLHNDKRVTKNKRQKNVISVSVAIITETNQVMWSFLTNTIAPGGTIMYMVISVAQTQTSMMACLHVGALQAHADGPTTFGVQSHYRSKVREAFVRWDCGERVRRAALRKAAPVVGSYQVGDIVSYCSEPRAGEHGLQRSSGSRLIDFEKDKNSLGETQPRTCWII